MRFVWLAVFALVIVGCRVPFDENRQFGPRPTPTAAPLFGAALYAERCALCHGDQGEGKGKVGSAIGNPEFLATASDTFLADAIALGRPGTTMSPWRDNGMTDDQIQSLVKHMRTWQKSPPVALPDQTARGDVARGKALYTEFCASCHGPDGLTRRDPNLLGTDIGNPVFLSQASDAFLTYAIAQGRSGTTMTAYASEKGGPLDPRAIEDIVTFMRSWPK
jgi:cytochrome c oxidase cbb3-type subunit III